MPTLWNKSVEEKFFKESANFATPEQLFYKTDDDRYLAYWTKDYTGIKSTLQSRNSLIGDFTEKWTRDLIQNIIKDKKLYAVQGAICEEIALTNQSPADVIISKTENINQKPRDILLIFEVKMSIVWNWELISKKELKCIGDYKTHQGNPGLLRSDSMLKAIGKSINIRVSSFDSAKIPIIVIGNTPITNSYLKKVDQLKLNGVIQSFWSINPKPLDNNEENLKRTNKNGFYRFDSDLELRKSIDRILSEEFNFFSSMRSKIELGKIIELADKEKEYEKKAELFLNLIKE